METGPLASSLGSRILKVISFYFIVFKSQVLYLFIFITWKRKKENGAGLSVSLDKSM
jgi:hypothetical protein